VLLRKRVGCFELFVGVWRGESYTMCWKWVGENQSWMNGWVEVWSAVSENCCAVSFDSSWNELPRIKTAGNMMEGISSRISSYIRFAKCSLAYCSQALSSTALSPWTVQKEVKVVVSQVTMNRYINWPWQVYQLSDLLLSTCSSHSPWLHSRVPRSIELCPSQFDVLAFFEKEVERG